ncbi:38799_t:CDS:2 [Gigaspora margarita]|uniref:38799_t:CDS:1 n=1 Tax=Gigaspora margarita TaxID=4874 RepID=A0ABM8W0P9_GIGMA|nr:38799_t:CDS:2 [Gigaspora margarita]
MTTKSECQEQVIDVWFMKIIDSKVGNNKNRNQIEKDKRINETFKGKATSMKNEALPVRSNRKMNSSRAFVRSLKSDKRVNISDEVELSNLNITGVELD